ncbi:MAG: hypothetical protein IH991_07805 [Planctomycetes bacterium]|nr:hypothetical protein [Planctomycetota bacterium]
MIPWQIVNTQSDLNALREAVCWEDSEIIEYYVSHFALPGFPADTNLSGYRLPNVYMLVDSCSKQAPHLEIVWIHADNFDAQFAQYPFVGGSVDSLHRVEITDYTKTIRMRCARLIYRFRDDLPPVPQLHFARMFQEIVSDREV